MALRFRWVRENMEKARERLRANPDDDLSDLIEKMDQDDAVFKKQSRMVILRNFIVNGLFGYDHKGALRGITKIIALKPPHKQSIQDDVIFKKQSRMVILRNFIVNGLFGYDHKGALRGITKIITLKPPHKPVDSKKANELLLILWESCAIFKDDVDLLIKELERDDSPEVSLEELPYQ